MHLKNQFLLSTFILLSTILTAQKANRVVHEQCATMERLQSLLERNPQLKARFEQQRSAFTSALKTGAYRLGQRGSAGNRTVFQIPVVFHIVSTNPASVTDAMIQAQMDTLNRDFSGTNGDSTRIPSYFKSLFGKSGIQFCLAQQTPAGEPTSGIERIKTNTTSFSTTNDPVKHSATGGVDSWDTKNYFNIWVCPLSDGVLGYSTFPDDPSSPEEQGVVIEYRSLPGGSLTGYNFGKTLTHETGHYFNLYHIWGDDGGACTGSDDVDDTPNQADKTSGAPAGIKTDACTPGGNGIMYQNYMDYTDDIRLVMFTTEQVSRMESAFTAYRSSLLTSKGCSAPVIRNYDARLSSIDQPAQRLCIGTFTPAVTLRNQGSQVLTSVTVSAKIDNGAVTNYNWKGSLAYLASTTVSLPNLSMDEGTHKLTVYVSSPDNTADENVTNDTLSSTIVFYNPVKTVSESFEANTFPPAGWDIVNPDKSITWKRVIGIAKTGTASVMMDNFNYTSVGEHDDLRLPNVGLQNIDSAFLSFQVAAAVYTDTASTTNPVWDTLQVLASTDCGATYTSLYKKYGKDLITTAPTTSEFIPRSTEWRKDSVNLVNYIGVPNLLLAIRNSNGYENDIYLDDINVRTVTVNPNLKSQGFLVTPNPTRGALTVQFYPQPVNLRAIQIFSLEGQKLEEITVGNGQDNNLYRFNISRYSAGTYIVRAVFTNKVITRKTLKF